MKHHLYTIAKGILPKVKGKSICINNYGMHACICIQILKLELLRATNALGETTSANPTALTQDSPHIGYQTVAICKLN